MIREFAKPYIMLDANGKIYNIEMHTSYEDANQFARAVYGDGASADEYRYLVQIGDIKKDGVYYNIGENGELTEAEYIPSDEEKIGQLETSNIGIPAHQYCIHISNKQRIGIYHLSILFLTR